MGTFEFVRRHGPVSETFMTLCRSEWDETTGSKPANSVLSFTRSKRVCSSVLGPFLHDFRSVVDLVSWDTFWLS